MEKRGMMKRFLAESLKELMLQKSFEKLPSNKSVIKPESSGRPFTIILRTNTQRSVTSSTWIPLTFSFLI